MNLKEVKKSALQLPMMVGKELLCGSHLPTLVYQYCDVSTTPRGQSAGTHPLLASRYLRLAKKTTEDFLFFRADY